MLATVEVVNEEERLCTTIESFSLWESLSITKVDYRRRILFIHVSIPVTGAETITANEITASLYITVFIIFNRRSSIF